MRRHLIPLLLGFMLCMAMFFAEPAITPTIANAVGEDCMYINDQPPFSYLGQGKQMGLLYELLGEMATRAGMSSCVSSVPFNRLAIQVKARPNSMGAIWRQPELEQSYTWVLKLFEEPVILVGKSGSSVDIFSIETARTLRIGVVLGSPAELVARRYGFQHLDVSNSVAANAWKLQQGRIDAWLAVPSVIYAAQRQIGSDINAVRFGLPIENTSMYLSCARVCNEREVARWRVAAQSMKKDGSYARIIEKYTQQVNPYDSSEFIRSKQK